MSNDKETGEDRRTEDSAPISWKYIPGRGSSTTTMLPAFWIFLIFTDLTRCEQPEAQEVSKGVDWLTRYGYLPPPDPISGQLQTLESLTDAIKSMQRFAGIRETGMLDQETLQMMKRPRCSLPDIIGTSEIMRKRRKRYALAGTVWKKTTLTWRVIRYPQKQTLNPNLVDSLLYQAFMVWSKVSPLDFKKATGDVDILIEFSRSHHGDGYPFDGAGGTLAHAFFPGDHPVSGDTHFDDDETWTYNTQRSEGTDLFAVAVHEFGHAIGLAHSSASSSIMRPYYSGSVGPVQDYQLPQDDVWGIEQMYGRRTQPTEKSPREDPAFNPKIPEVPYPYPSSGPHPDLIDRCRTHFDAVSNIRGEAFFFKDQFFWRMQRAGNLVSLNAAQIKNFWQGLPTDMKKIDTVYERMTDNKIVFFIGSQYWVFSNTIVESGYPRSISDFGLPGPNIDAAFVWPHNGKTYFFKGDEFWRFDDQKGQMDSGYPKKVSLWKGIPADLDDIMGWNNGATYFFKGQGYWRMKGGDVEVDSRRSRSTHRDWMHCDIPTEDPLPPVVGDPKAGGCSCSIENKAGAAVTHRVLWLLHFFWPACVAGCFSWNKASSLHCSFIATPSK
ncbi:matrix metalloproteinase-25-like [Heterodontus francisci]|uniref:matrix metalloproteinase-25-like n=1 Tax=Heterodontus francisci TaxID=7792 RepID=UPI00355B15C3